jgi:carbonic anhydrase/acetyltransferase-like protein (isoleucine patch superfamily)
MLALGIPAKPLRPLGEKDLSMIRQTIRNYQEMKVLYGEKR